MTPRQIADAINGLAALDNAGFIRVIKAWGDADNGTLSRRDQNKIVAACEPFRARRREACERLRKLVFFQTGDFVPLPGGGEDKRVSQDILGPAGPEQSRGKRGTFPQQRRTRQEARR